MCTNFSTPSPFPTYCWLSILGIPGNRQRSRLPVQLFQETNRNDGSSTPVNRMGVAVHILPEQYGTLPMGDSALRITTDEQTHEKSSGLGHDEYMEHGILQ